MVGIPNLGIIFCRFIYVRYAHGLVADMGRLFHKIVLLAISVFTLHMLLIWPIQTMLSENDYTDMIKGKICNRKPFPQDRESFISFHIKPKMMVCFLTGFYCLTLFYIHTSVQKKKARYSIPRRRWTLMNFEQHALYLCLLGSCALFDQLIINIILQVFHSQFGVDVIFQIWWLWHLVMFLSINVLAPLPIICAAKLQYPEFNGLKARRFPGQEKPRVEPKVPRRMSTVENDAVEVKTSFITESSISSHSRSYQPTIQRKVGFLTAIEIH